MKTYTQDELEEILELHKKWSKNENDGVRAILKNANLICANLSGAYLRGANLISADLRSADIRSADIRSADLSGANLIGANLKNANLIGANLGGADLRCAILSGANLSGANLIGANLNGADLIGTIGDMNFIKSMQCEKYPISYTSNILNVGCQSHSIDDWKNFDDDEIEKMDEGALEWWNRWEPIIMEIIKISQRRNDGVK